MFNDYSENKPQEQPYPYPYHWSGYMEETSPETTLKDLTLRVIKLEKIVEEFKILKSCLKQF
jgi:hypothetical protein